MSLDVSNLQYDEAKVEYCSKAKYGIGGVATHKEIKLNILKKVDIKASSLYIGQIKDKVGIKERPNYNVGSENGKVSNCPYDKEVAIIDNFKYFGMIYN